MTTTFYGLKILLPHLSDKEVHSQMLNLHVNNFYFKISHTKEQYEIRMTLFKRFLQSFHHKFIPFFKNQSDI